MHIDIHLAAKLKGSLLEDILISPLLMPKRRRLTLITRLLEVSTQRKNKEKEKSAATIQDLIDLYINNHASYNNKSWESIKYTLNHYIPPDWKDRKAKSIERWEVFSFLEGIRNAGKGATCNRVRAYLKVMFEYAVERSILDASPLWGIKKMYKTTSRDRALDNNEIKYFWNNFATVINCSKVTELTLKTMLATGQRSGEVRHMKTEDLNYQNLIWTIPASISKNKKEHRVPLSPLAIELIREAYQLHKKHDYIFSSPVKPNEPMDRHAIARPVANFSKKGDIEKFTPHDLRRTFTTHCTRNSLRRDWIKYVLNHSEGDVTAVYDKYEYDDEKKSIFDAWAGTLLEIINSGDEQEEEKTDVVNFLLVEKEE